MSAMSRALGFDGEVFAPGEWGRVPNGGAWFVIDGQRVDICYRDLDLVEAWTSDAAQGRFQVLREVGYVAGVPTYSYPAELALNKHLVGVLPRPEFPAALQETAPARWRRLADGALKFADAHARRDDATACAGNLAIAAFSSAHARLCERAEWYLNDKDLLARAGLAPVGEELRALGADLLGATERVGVLLGKS